MIAVGELALQCINLFRLMCNVTHITICKNMNIDIEVTHAICEYNPLYLLQLPAMINCPHISAWQLVLLVHLYDWTLRSIILVIVRWYKKFKWILKTLYWFLVTRMIIIVQFFVPFTIRTTELLAVRNVVASSIDVWNCNEIIRKLATAPTIWNLK